MRTDLHDELHRWLEAETAGGDAEAERALARLMTALPGPVPSPGFAVRVMRAAVAASVPAPVTASAAGAAFGPWAKGAIAACLLLAGVAVALLPTTAFAFASVVRPAEVLAGLARGLVAFADGASELLAFWRLLDAVHASAMLAMSTPQVMLSLLTALLLSTLSLTGLRELLSTERKEAHAQAL